MRISDWSSDVCSSDLQITADNHPHHLVRAFKDAVDAKVAVDALDRIIHQIAIAAVKLERAIGDPHRLVGRKALCHGGEMRLVRRALCHLDGSGIKERSEEHTSELQSLMRISYAVFCLKKKTSYTQQIRDTHK